MRYKICETVEVDSGVWAFSEYRDERPQTDAYLVIGKKRALVIDALTEDTTLYEKARELTGLPIDVLVTHGHRDHAGAALTAFHEAGCDIYMNEADLPMLKQGVEASWFTPLTEGKRFDIGGRELETLALPGHTPGSVVFLDREAQLLFTGDAVGAGVFWMQLSHSLPLGQFLVNLGAFREKIKDLDRLRLCPGHRHQSPVQLTSEFIDDVLYMTSKIISGEMVGEDTQMGTFEGKKQCKTARYKLMTAYCYDPANIV